MVAIGSAVDNYITYKILTLIATDWQKLPAYKLGIIDAKGNALKKTWELKTTAEKNAYTSLHVLVFNLKRLLNKVPNTARKLGTIAAAAWLLKEQLNLSDSDMQLILSESEAPVNTSSGGNIAGLDNNPPVRRKVKPNSKFAGHPVFKVSSKVYNEQQWPRDKWQRWTKFMPISESTLEEDANDINNIIDYGRDNPNDPIIIQDRVTGLMKYIVHGRR